MLRTSSLRLLPLLLSAGVVSAQSLSAQSPLPNYPGGRSVSIQGHSFFLDCSGAGSPTILLFSGQGGGFLDWLLVQPQLAATNRVCSFDPPGYGRSDATPDADTFAGNVRAFSEALSAIGEHGPFLLVGQSFGGIEARLFQLQHPSLVRAMVLLDSYEIAAPWKGQMVPLDTLSAEELRSTLPDHTHAPRPVAPTEVEPQFRKLPPAAQQEHLADVQRMIAALDFRKEPAVMESFRSTLLALHQHDHGPDPLNGIPLYVLTRDGASPPEEQMQQGYLALSTHSHRSVAKGSGHFIQLDDPALVLATIHQALADSATHPAAR